MILHCKRSKIISRLEKMILSVFFYIIHIIYIRCLISFSFVNKFFDKFIRHTLFYVTFSIIREDSVLLLRRSIHSSKSDCDGSCYEPLQSPTLSCMISCNNLHLPDISYAYSSEIRHFSSLAVLMIYLVLFRVNGGHYNVFKLKVL